MLLLRYLLLLFFAFVAQHTFAQLPVHFEGLARTQVQYLVDQHIGLLPGKEGENLRFYPDPELSQEQALVQLRQQLINLPAITQVTWRVDSVAGKPEVIHLGIEESRTVFPLLNLGGVKDNFFYMVGINDIHFRGRAQRFTAFYQNTDGEHNYYIGLSNDAYRGTRWGYTLESQRYAAVEPVFFPGAAVNYRYANLSFGAGLSYTFPSRHVFRLGVSNFYEHYLKVSEDLNSPGPDDARLDKALLKFSHTINQVDHFGERQSGTDHQTIAQAVFNLEDASRFFIIWHDFRYYRLLNNRGNLAARLRTGISTNENSPFAPFVLDSQVNIRGSGNRIDRGTAQLILNLEYRHTVWMDRRERFAAQVVGFSDLGTWRNPGGELSDLVASENIRHFVGAGLRVLSLKAYNAALRVDYGVDVRNTKQRGVVLGFGQYF